MGSFTFNLPNGKPFEVKGPAGLTLAQAKAAFDQQASTGSLVGFKPGQILSAATQAAGGLASAQAVLGQGLSGIIGALGKNIPGAAGVIGALSTGAAAQGGAVAGSLAGGATKVSGVVGPATAPTVKTTSAGITKVGGPLASIPNSLSGIATTSVGTINRALAGRIPTDPINTANFVKQTPAIAPIGPMPASTVTGVLAQQSNLVNQKSSIISNTKGVGTFGLDAQQLENAGYIKPGTAAKVGVLDATDPPTMQQVLKSPAVWTGKNGIKNLSGLLSNPKEQSLIQQTLMAKGVGIMGTQGIPVKNLSAQGLAGMALNAAKNPAQAIAFAKGLPIPGDATGSIAAGFGIAIAAGAFAANLAGGKIALPFKAEAIPKPSADTVNRDVVNAASSRIVGNPKVPTPNYGAPKATDITLNSLILGFTNSGTAIDSVTSKLNAVESSLKVLEQKQSITESAWQSLNAEYQQAQQFYNTQQTDVIGPAFEAYNAAANDIRTQAKSQAGLIETRVQTLLEKNADLKKRVSLLQKKIEGIN